MNDMARFIDDRPADGVFRVHRDVFADPELFELEQTYIFARTWNFLALESQVAQPHDFVTAYIGRTPVLVSRDGQGRLGAFLNACRHKGAVVCRLEQGNARAHVCPYHGWGYDSGGRNTAIKDRDAGAYAQGVNADSHDLIPIAKLATYNGLVFGSLSAEVPPIEEFLGDFRLFIDLAMEQGPQGMEAIPGRMAYSYKGNWKLQLDNGLDAYHLTSTHQSFMQIQTRRRDGAGNLDAQSFDWAKRAKQKNGIFSFDNGHTALWFDQAEVQKRPIWPVIDEVKKRVGEMRAEWMLKVRNVTVFPNMQIAEGVTLMIRTFRPVSVDRTEMRSYCLAPIGEAPELRVWRLRQFEDFFNPAGLATPDDTMVYEECQRGFDAEGLGWLQGYARGISLIEPGANETAKMLGIAPRESANGVFETHSEACLHAPYREWARLIQAGLGGKAAYA